jgi:integrase
MGSISQHSSRTLGERRDALGKFVWFLEERSFPICGVAELRRFFAYLNSGHLEAEGRWGNPRQIKPLRPVTIQTYHKHLRSFFNWLVREELLNVSPMEKIPAIVARPDQVQPYTDDQLSQLIKAAKNSLHRRRDEALIYFFLTLVCALLKCATCGCRTLTTILDDAGCLVRATSIASSTLVRTQLKRYGNTYAKKKEMPMLPFFFLIVARARVRH